MSMEITVEDITTLGGTNLPLDSRRRDALATYARLAAAEEGLAAQTWVRRTWGFTVYEAKDLLKGNASENLWERAVKSKRPTKHKGWRLILPVMGAVVGHSVHDFFRAEIRAATKDLQDLENDDRLADQVVRRLPFGGSLPHGRRGLADVESGTRQRSEGPGNDAVRAEGTRRSR